MRTNVKFDNREQAGQEMAAALRELDIADPVVLALPRGGVPVALEVAKTLKAPLDLLLVRKIGVPSQPELAVAAIVNGDKPELVVNRDVAYMTGLDEIAIQKLADVQLEEIERRRKVYFAGRSHASLQDKTLIIVDDGIATGATVLAAIRALRRKKPHRLIVAAVVAPLDTVRKLEKEGAEVYCLATPEPFYAIGMHYRDFHQLSDDEVIALMDEAEKIYTEDNP